MSIYAGLYFLVLLFLSVPVAHALFIAASAGMVTIGKSYMLGQTIISLYDPTQSFPMIAIPFFILAGDLMMSGRFGDYLIKFSKLVVGHLKGGLAQVSVLGSLLFGGVSGSAVADASALGNAIIPVQKKEGYPPGYPAAVNAASSTISVLIPPSIPLILYGLVAEVSIPKLFIAGILPGILLAVSIFLICFVINSRKDLPRSPLPGGFKTFRQDIFKAFPAMLMPVLIIVLARGGVVTPTEISVFAVAYALFVGIFIYRDLTVAIILRCILTSGMMTGVIMLVIMGSGVLQWILSAESVPENLSAWILSALQSKWLIIIAMNVLLIVIGTFLDLPAAVLLLAPIFIGVAGEIGLDPIQLGVMMVVNLAIGLYTPPVGTTLFVSISIERVSMGKAVMELLPFYLAAIVILALVSFVPAITSVLL
ncbi:TRAP transporter large permease [Rhodobium gokarnense]|uniref:TRAP transporter large permease protein n=1 Tax=Rhodobium gokarnense TaxID=364296 RepID=A0ABT3HFA9_9HYPH|nr:TRAP transporter large permease [Rhodobium gokarnense]MCW2308971.1 tripartite ATP-independent transporter DctM subunit [Rhodobium gokarnense]